MTSKEERDKMEQSHQHILQQQSQKFDAQMM
jgi:hypothetical protein